MVIQYLPTNTAVHFPVNPNSSRSKNNPHHTGGERYYSRSMEMEAANEQIAALQAELATMRDSAERELQEADQQLRAERTRASEELQRTRDEADASTSAALEESRIELQKSR